MRAGVYYRVSHEESLEGHSLDAQSRIGREFCASRGWEIVKEYYEEAKSARAEDVGKRPKFKEMMDDALRRDLIDVVVVHKLDRYSRNLKVLLHYFDELSKAGKAFVSITENMDFSTPWGRFALTMLGAMAQLYSDNLSFEYRKGKRERALKGFYNGDVPWPYLKVKGGIPMVDESQREGAILAANRYATGTFTDTAIGDLLNQAGYRLFPKWEDKNPHRLFTKDTVCRLLKEGIWFWAGYVNYKGERAKGCHEAIIPEDLLEKCLEARNRFAGRTGKGRPVKPYRIYLLGKILYCYHCGEPLRCQPNFAGYTFYAETTRSRGKECVNHDRVVRTVAFDRIVEEILKSLTLPDAWRSRVLDYLAKQSDVEERLRRKGELKARLKRLVRCWIDLGEQGMSESEYSAEKKALEQQIENLSAIGEEETFDAGEFLKSLAEVWDAATEVERQEIVRTVLEKVLVDTSTTDVIAFKPRRPFLPLFATHPHLKEKDGLIYPSFMDTKSGSDGIRTRDLSLDRAAC